MQRLFYIGVVCVILYLLSGVNSKAVEKKYRHRRRALDAFPGESYYGFHEDRGLVNTYKSLKSLTPPDDPYRPYRPYHPSQGSTSAENSNSVNDKKINLDHKKSEITDKLRKDENKMKGNKKYSKNNDKTEKKEVIVRMGKSKDDKSQIIQAEPTLKRQKRKNISGLKPAKEVKIDESKEDVLQDNENEWWKDDREMKVIDHPKIKQKNRNLLQNNDLKKEKKAKQEKNKEKGNKKGKKSSKKQKIASMKISDEDMEKMIRDVYGQEYPYDIFNGDFASYQEKNHRKGIISDKNKEHNVYNKDFKAADVKNNQHFKAADVKNNQDFKRADVKDNQNFKAADVKSNKDFKAADVKSNQDFKAADVKDNQDFKAADVKSNQDFKAAYGKNNQDFKEADAKGKQDFKAADVKHNQDFKAADVKSNQDFKAADVKNNQDFKAADVKNSQDFKAADVKSIQDFKAADVKSSEDFKTADVKNKQDFKAAEAKDSQDFKAAGGKSDQDFKAADNKIKAFKPADVNKNEDFKPANNKKDFKASDFKDVALKPDDAKASRDFKPADANNNNDFKQVEAKDTVEFKPTGVTDDQDFKSEDIKDHEDFKPADKRSSNHFKFGDRESKGTIDKTALNLVDSEKSEFKFDKEKKHQSYKKVENVKSSHYKTIDRNDKPAWKSYKKEDMQGDMPFGEMDPYRTPFDSQTSPNPPTTKPTKVTPMASDKKSSASMDRPYGSCYDDDDCYVGRVCLGGTCVCGDETLCLGHRKPVCGSDGQLYSSHCELHRQACVQRKHIRIDHNVQCASTARQSTGQVDTLPKQVQGMMCEYSVKPGVEGVLWGQQVTSTTKATMEDCRDSCDKAQLTGGCVAFEYSQITKHCVLYDNKEDVIFWPNPDMVYYEQIRCKKQIDPRCEFDEFRVSAEQIFAVCNIRSSTDKTLEQCKSACGDCAAFTYVPENGDCEIHQNKACQNMLDERGHAHYVHKCDRRGKQCDYIEIIPGKAPFMCSTATETTNNVVECHDACVKSGCEAFKYQMGESPGKCDLFFDRSCITMLNKRKENYYVRRCNKPEDCQYEEVVSSMENQQCNIMSSTVDTFSECHTACGDCTGFKFDYITGQCSLYDKESCLPDKKYNFYIVRCPEAKAPRVAVSKLHRNLNLQPVISRTLPANQENVPQPLVLPSDKTTEKKGDINLPQDDNVIVAPPPKQELKGQTDLINRSPGNQDIDSASKEVENKIFGDKPIIEAGEKECTEEEYQNFKAALLRYHCVRFGEKDCDKTQIKNKEYVAALMFSLYDRDRGGAVETKELWESQVIYKFEKLSEMCTLVDIMTFDDNGDDVLYKREFINAFNMPDEITRQRIEIIPILATAGNGLEIQCGIHPSTDNQLIWERHGVDMALVSFPDIAVFGDGTLYFDSVGVHQTGNYTCFDRDRPGFKQVHQLQVQMKPLVKVSPSSVLMRSDHTDMLIQCHAEGVPTPKITWEINGKPLPIVPYHYIRSHSNGTLMIFNTNVERDTGEYKCVAENMAGKSESVIQVFIYNPLLKARKEHSVVVEQSYFIFHKNGYSVYNPENCDTERSVKSNFGNLKYIPEELDEAPSLCEHKKPCVWGEGVAVKNKFIYVAQPYQNRVVVIDSVHSMNPVQFVETDSFPVKLYYVEHLDEVWVLCWKKDRNTGSKTIVVIRDASKDSRHHMVHTQPIGNRFDQVQDIFLPPQNDLDHPFHYGYVLHNKQQGLFKLDLSTMHYTKVVDVSSFDCVPENVAFVPIGGYIIVKCIKTTEIESSRKVSTEKDTRTLQIVIDYLTDTAVSNFTMYGTPYVSPDSRTLVTVNEVTGKVLISRISEDGHIQNGFSVSVKSSVNGVAFYHSDTKPGYNLIMASANNPVMYHVNLQNGRITTIRDVDSPRGVKLWPWSSTKRAVVSGYHFSDYVASPSESSLAIISGKEKRLHCKFSGLDRPDTLVFSTATIG